MPKYNSVPFLLALLLPKRIYANGLILAEDAQRSERIYPLPERTPWQFCPDQKSISLSELLFIQATLEIHDFLFFYFFIFFSFIFISWRLITLQYCSGFFLPYIDMNQPWIYMCSPSWTPLPPSSPSQSSGSSQCTSPEHLSHASNLDWR